MAVPDIGTTIADGYRRGFDRLAETAPSALVPAVLVGVVAGAIAQVQAELLPDVGEILAAAFSGETVDKLSRGDLATLNALNALTTAVQMVIGLAGLAVFGGALHRARHAQPAADVTAPHAAGHASTHGSTDVPGPGAVLGAVAAAAGALMPKLAVLVALAVAGPLVSIISSVLGGLVTLGAFVALVYFIVRWTYAPIVAGSGEATGDAAFARSEQVVGGNFWGTLGVMLVVGLAIFIPVAIVGGIVGAILPGSFLSAFASSTISVLGILTLYASALESAWAQVEADGLASGAPHASDPEDFLAGPGTNDDAGGLPRA